MPSPSRPSRLLLCAAASLTFAVGCIIETEETAGRPCESPEQCADEAYDCVATGAEGQKTCQLIFPPQQRADGGTDAGMVPFTPWCGQVEQLLTDYCVSCHGEDRSPSGNLPFRTDVYHDLDGGLPDGGLLLGAKSKAISIRTRVVSGSMPPPSSPQMTPEEIQAVSNWVLSGAPFCDGGM